MTEETKKKTKNLPYIVILFVFGILVLIILPDLIKPKNDRVVPEQEVMDDEVPEISRSLPADTTTNVYVEAEDTTDASLTIIFPEAVETDQVDIVQLESGEDYSQSLVEVQPESIPEYAGEDFIILNSGIPMFNQYDVDNLAGQSFSPLDALGRCGMVWAMIDKSMMPTEPRGQIGDVRPTGWHTVKYPDVISDLYLYNRCHLIGYALTGENANVLNLITGTRYFNTTIMLPFERDVVQTLEDTDNRVLYRVTPYFVGDELVARGVEMEAMSVEDGGESLCFHVFCYNIQPGIEIDYATGESWVE